MDSYIQGPWRAERRNGHLHASSRLHIFDSRMRLVTAVTGSMKEAAQYEAKARLISAAPDLLEALLKATRELNEIRARDGVPYTHNHVPASVDADYFSSVVDECFAAIDKATT